MRARHYAPPALAAVLAKQTDKLGSRLRSMFTIHEISPYPIKIKMCWPLERAEESFSGGKRSGIAHFCQSLLRNPEAGTHKGVRFIRKEADDRSCTYLFFFSLKASDFNIFPPSWITYRWFASRSFNLSIVPEGQRISRFSTFFA